MLNGNSSSKETATNGGERARMGPRKTEKERHKRVDNWRAGPGEGGQLAGKNRKQTKEADN